MVATNVDRIRHALSQADFPADKAELVRSAERAGADTDTVRALRAIPPVAYANLAEVVRSVPLESGTRPEDQAARRRTHTKPGLGEQDKDIPPHPIAEEEQR